MKSLFESTRAGDLALANRIAMAPLTRNRSPEAIPTELVATYYAPRASAGLIISEATAISPQGQGYADVPGLYGTEQLDGWKKVTHAVHEAGGKIVVQLWHVGRVSHTDLQPGNAAPVAPSAIRAHTKTVLIKNGVPTFTETSQPRALDAEELFHVGRDGLQAADRVELFRAVCQQLGGKTDRTERAWIGKGCHHAVNRGPPSTWHRSSRGANARPRAAPVLGWARVRRELSARAARCCGGEQGFEQT